MAPGSTSKLLVSGRIGSKGFLDVKAFSPFAKSYRDIPLMKCYKRCEQQKKRAYEECIRRVEHGSFTPLIFSTHKAAWVRRQQPCTSVLPPFYQARDQNRIPNRSTRSDAGLDLLFSNWRSCAWEGPAPPICTSSGTQSRGLWFSNGPHNQPGEDLNNCCYSTILTTLIITIVTVLSCCTV